jgi:hypothetical protein
MSEEELCAVGTGRQVFCVARINGVNLRALIDSGATFSAISEKAVRRTGIGTQQKDEPKKFSLADGQFCENAISEETKPIRMKIGDHEETIQMNVISMSHDIILGQTWLEQHHLEGGMPPIDVVNKKVRLDECICKKGIRLLRKGASKVRQVCAAVRIQTDTHLSKEFGGMKEVKPGKTVEQMVPVIYHDYLDLFIKRENLDALPEHQPWDHGIVLRPGSTPPFGPVYQQTREEQRELKEFIEENTKKGWIRESKSSAGSPVMFVPKPGGKKRLVVDFRKLNDMTEKDRYTLPLIQDLQDWTAGAVFFTKIDLRDGFYNIRIKQGDEWKTAFRTHLGLYEFCVMPMGLTNAPATFQRHVNHVLREYLYKFALAYLDDILIYSKTMEEHMDHVRKVLQKLRDFNLQAKPEKCEFHVKKVQFLGYVLTGTEIRMDPQKIEAVRNWPTPTNKSEVRSFLGFSNYYRKFIAHYGEIAKSLTNLTRDDAMFEWTPEADKVFNELKKRYTEEPILTHFDGNKPSTVETDASDGAIGAWLGQPDENGVLRPVAYYSRQLHGAELNYDVHDKELLAIVEMFRAWRHYLSGAKFPVKVITDHKNLTYFLTTKVLTGRHIRWWEKIVEFDFTIHHQKGSENARADALSRQKTFDKKKKVKSWAFFKEKDGAIVLNKMEIALTVIEWQDDAWEKRIKAAYDGDLIAEKILNETPDDFVIDANGMIRFKDLIYIPASISKEFVTEQHTQPTFGHGGITKLWELLSETFYFPHMLKRIKEWTGECHLCKKAKASRHKPYGMIKPIQAPKYGGQVITMDFIVKLPKSKEPATGTEYDSILVMIDKLTKYGIFIPAMESWNADEVAYITLRHQVAYQDIPEQYITDRDKIFASKFWQTLIARLGTKHKLSTSYHPQTDGQTERVNQILETYLRLYVNDQQNNWVEHLPVAQLAYNGTYQSTIGMSPFKAKYGRDMMVTRTPLQAKHTAEAATLSSEKLIALHKQLSFDITFLNQRMALYANRKRSQEPSFKKGDKVYLLRKNLKTKRKSDKLDWKKFGAYEILEKVSDVNYKLKLPKGSRLHPIFHVSLLEPAAKNAPLEHLNVKDENEADIYDVEKILDSRINMETGQLEYFVKWLDWEDIHNNWEPVTNLNCPKKLEEFHRRNPSAVREATAKTSQGTPTPRRSKEADRAIRRSQQGDLPRKPEEYARRTTK